MTVRIRGTRVGLLVLLAGGLNATIIKTVHIRTAHIGSGHIGSGHIGSGRAEFHASYSLVPNGRVVVQNVYGDVRITAWDRDEVMVEAVKHATDARRLNDAQIVVDSSSGMVSIQTQYSGSDAEHPTSVEYHIMVPRGANLENVKLMNGGLSLIGMAGPVKASSVNGSIKAEKMGGQTELSTVNGQLDADFQRVSKCHSISLTSINGPIRLSLPLGAGANVSAQNLSGGIDADFGRAWRAPGGHRLDAAMNGGGAQIRLHNVNGGISIHSILGRHAVRTIS